jgi:hypothetical protein
MSQPSSQPSVRVPRWLIWVGSVAIVFHLGAVGVNNLAAMSGPWPDAQGGEYIGPPYLAQSVTQSVADYLKAICMEHRYHFLANRLPGTPGVYLEFHLKDEGGKDLATVKLPDDQANSWVRHRQSLLTQQVSWEDRFIVPPPTEDIPAPGQEPAKEQYWEPEQGQLKLVTKYVNELPRNRPLSAPKEWSFMLARSYSRYLCRVHGAAKVEVLRHHQQPVRPFVLHADNLSARDFEEQVSNFGEFSR